VILVNTFGDKLFLSHKSKSDWYEAKLSRFFDGPKTLSSLDQILLAGWHEDIHIVATESTAQFRELNLQNSFTFCDLHYWVASPEISSHLNFEPGKSYVIKPQKQGKLSIRDFTYSVQPVQLSQVFDHVFQRPIVVTDFTQFAQLETLNCNMVLAYCDPKLHGAQAFRKAKQTLAKVQLSRQPVSVQLSTGEQRESDVLFVITTERLKLMGPDKTAAI